MRNSIQKIQKYKNNKKITMLTAYDYSTAKYADMAGVDMILVGDSLAQVVLGYDSTVNISMNEMKIFVSAVSRGVENALLVADMPYGSFNISLEETTRNAVELVKSGANAVKIEGCSDLTLKTVKHLTQNGIPVVGHLGFTPTNINALGGNKVQAKDAQKTINLLNDALKLQEAGCFAVVLELVPCQSSKYVTERLDIVTIGIGAGVDCDGQVLVSDDVLGKFDKFSPKFVRKYADLKDVMLKAIQNYCKDVETRAFPTIEESFTLSDEEIEKLESYK